MGTGDIKERDKMTECPQCKKNTLVLVSEDDKKTVYVCTSCGKQVIEKKD